MLDNDSLIQTLQDTKTKAIQLQQSLEQAAVNAGEVHTLVCFLTRPLLGVGWLSGHQANGFL